MLNSVSRTPSSWPIYSILCSILAATVVRSACVDNSTDTAGLQKLLTEGGEGYTLSLCAGQVYSITQSLNFTNTSQEISTEGYPTDSTRAMLVVSGPKTPQVNHTTAVLGDCENCDFIRIKNIMIDGDRDLQNMAPLPGGGNIEIGGANQGQIVENVRSFNPRGWSCLHIAEGPFACSNATIRGNDIGPCGSDYFQYWADGVSLSCANSLVENNDIKDATDAGIVIFGSPGSTVRNNTISATDRVMLGGINMVDFDPWQGNFSNLLVENNRIYGGFADEYGNSSLGVADQPAVIKLGK
ncbi:hypothetical protein FFLO_03046 [Filobasidium floriforme]|uniref:Right handed beta helix domain-containing protein n=1 Tax=Filobasidium floriforme TaxID=5210 RepID=A0A8K0JMX1_9TREE|nr:hypothetical protein FFLO_03046 [Filobasidium floriforme]